MSKMSELSATLDELSEVGRTLIACGEDLVKAVCSVQACFTSDEAEPVPEPLAEETAPESKTYSKEDVRAMLAELSQAGFRSEAKGLVKKYSGGGTLSDIDPARYAELAAEVEALHA